MEPIQEGLTWRQIRGLFEAHDDYDVQIRQQLRRTKSWKRKRGEPETRKVVRLAVQRRDNGATKTVYRKNLKGLGDDFLDQTADAKVLGRLNEVLAGLAG